MSKPKKVQNRPRRVIHKLGHKSVRVKGNKEPANGYRWRDGAKVKKG